MKQISMIDFYIPHCLSTKSKKTKHELFNYVTALIPISRQSYNYRLNSLYTKDHLIKETYHTENRNGKVVTTVYYELTNFGIDCYNEAFQTLLIAE